MKANEVFIPEKFYYSKAHEWALIDKKGLVKVGITDYAQKKLHEVVFVDVPKKHYQVKKMEPIGTVESVKAVSEVFSPISGEIVKGNEELILKPELVNIDPYDKGWIAIIKPNNLKTDIKDLMKAEEYAKYIKSLK